jgi:hypothetical protein
MAVGTKYHHVLKKAARLGFYSRAVEANKLPLHWKHIFFLTEKSTKVGSSLQLADVIKNACECSW